MSEHDLRTANVEDLLARLGSAEAAPGGGAAAAVAGAMGASLVRMLARLTVGRKKYADHDELMQAIADQAGEESETLLGLASADATAYGAVMAAHALPQDGPDLRAARDAAIQAAFKGACEVPLRVMERCLEVLALAKTAVQHGNVNAAADGAAGAELARAAMRVASYNMKINLGSIDDAEYVEEARARMDEIDYMGGGAASTIDSHVNDLLNPTSPSVRS